MKIRDNPTSGTPQTEFKIRKDKNMLLFYFAFLATCVTASGPSGDVPGKTERLQTPAHWSDQEPSAYMHRNVRQDVQRRSHRIHFTCICSNTFYKLGRFVSGSLKYNGCQLAMLKITAWLLMYHIKNKIQER